MVRRLLEVALSDAIADHMTTDVLVVRDDDTVPDAVQALVNRGVDAAPVVDANGKVVGMLSASDVMIQDAHVHLPTIITMFGASMKLPMDASRYDQDIQRALASTVHELMRRGPITTTPDATMSDAATLMHDHDISRLPVIDGSGKLVGIVARGDVLRYLVGGSETDSTTAS